MNSIPEIFVAHTSELAESPVWDADNNRIYWVDIEKGILHWYNFSDQAKHELAIGQKIGSVALIAQNRLVAALENGFFSIDTLKKSVTPIIEIESQISTNRFNDGKCDPAGRFWAGTMSVIGKPNAGKLYMLDGNFRVMELLRGVGCSNGMAWSPDHATFYYIDSLSYQLVTYDFDMFLGAISNQKILIQFAPDEGIPDGMTTDSQGALWIAMWDGGNVSRYDPVSGKLLLRIKFPVARISSCTFGGPELSDLFITTARVGLSEQQLKDQPLAGSVFVIKNTGFTGSPAHPFLVSQRIV